MDIQPSIFLAGYANSYQRQQATGGFSSSLAAGQKGQFSHLVELGKVLSPSCALQQIVLSIEHIN